MSVYECVICVRVCVVVVESATVRCLPPLPGSFENKKTDSLYSRLSVR